MHIVRNESIFADRSKSQMKIITNSPEETIALAQQIGKHLKAGDCIAYAGGLGVGKTTFTRGLALGMGLDDLVCSPTFSIVNAYQGRDIALYHFDMYRIGDAEELESTGFYDYPQEQSVFAIEWAEHITEVLPPHTIRITLVRLSDTKREITLEGDARFADFGT